jgi:dynein heavy chain
MPHLSIFVPTVDTTRIQYLLDLLIRNKKSVLLVGEAGTAKTATVRQYLASLGIKMNKINILVFI